jgi:hypothetical protein
MDRDQRERAEPRDATTPGNDELKRNEALARYDAYPGIAALLLAVMAFLFIVLAYQFASDRVDTTGVSGRDKRVQSETPGLPSR